MKKRRRIRVGMSMNELLVSMLIVAWVLAMMKYYGRDQFGPPIMALSPRVLQDGENRMERVMRSYHAEQTPQEEERLLYTVVSRAVSDLYHVGMDPLHDPPRLLLRPKVARSFCRESGLALRLLMLDFWTFSPTAFEIQLRYHSRAILRARFGLGARLDLPGRTIGETGRSLVGTAYSRRRGLS